MSDYIVSIGNDEMDFDLGIDIGYYHCQPPHKGSPHTCDSDMDYYGYTDLDYSIVSIHDGETGELIAEGDDLGLPDGVDSDMVYQDVLEQITALQEY